MNTKEAVAGSLNLSGTITKMYLADLSDADLMERAVPNANHIAWQLGHFIATEAKGGAAMGGVAELPDGFAAKHSKGTAASDSPGDFFTKAQYLEYHDSVRAATLALLASLPDEKLDEPTVGPMASLAPTWGHMFILLAGHAMMHAGQFTTTRRKLGKPVLF